jgi:hypothetical protein
MADRLSAYADWLVANQNKQGTPEFETVANSYKQLRSQGVADNNQDRDGAFAYGIDNMQKMIGKGIEAGGRLVGSEAIENFGTRQVANQDRDIAQGGYQPQYAGSLRENYEKGTFLPALGEKLLETAPTGGAAIAGSGAVAAAAFLGAPAWLTFGGGAAVTGGSMLMGAGESALDTEEKTGSYDPKIATSIGALVGFLDKFGAGKVIPVDKIAKMSASEVAEELTKKGFGDAAKAFTGRVSKAGFAEGATETAQDAVVMTGTAAQGGDFTGTEVQDRLTDSFVLGTSMGGGTRATLDTAGAVGNAIGPNDTPTDPDAATDFSNRLNGIIEANNLNTKDLDKTSTEGARQAVDLAHVQIASEMKQKIADLKKRLKVDRLDPAEIVADKVEAEAGTREARSKTKSIVGQQEYNATERLVGDTKEGQELLRLFRESNELTRLHNSGYIGGLSRITDQLSPFSSNVGYTARSAAELPTRLIGTAAGATLNPAIPAAQIAAVGTGRAVDALTGRRSRVAKYVRDNQGRGGVSIDPDLPSLRQQNIDQDEAQKRREAELRQLNLELDNPPAGMDPDAQQQSPEAVMFKATGLTREGVKEVLAELERTVPQLAPEIASYRKMLTDGTYADALPELARAVAGEVERNPGKYSTRPGAYVPGVAPARGTVGYESPGYQRGILANRTFVDGIKMDVKTDPDLNQDDKDIITSALDNMAGNLGSDPVRTANNILDNAVDQAADKLSAAAYLGPYVDRVQEQQDQAQAKRRKSGPNIYRDGILDTSQDEDINYFVDLRSPETAPPRRKHREIGEELMNEQNQRFGRDLDPYNDAGDFETVADEMTKEAQFQSDKTPDAAHWYDNDIREAIATTAEVLPEINKTPDHRQLFLLLAALTSVGQKPKLNWRYAGSLAMHYYRTGELGEIGQIYSDKRKRFEERLVNPVTGKLLGQKAGSIEPGLYILRHMLNTRGLNETISWLNSTKTKAEIDAMRKEAGYGPQGKIKGGKNAVVPAIQLFGPKVGPFYMNLNGIHEVTVDLWASRTVRRHTGGLLADPKLEGSGLVDAPTELERPTMKDLFTRVGENLGVTPQSAQAILWAYEQELYNDLGANLIYEKFSEGAEAFRATEAVAYADRDARIASGQAGSGTNDAPASIEQSKQLSLDFGQRRTDSGLQYQTRPSVGSRPAQPEEVRETQQLAQVMFEIGKPGSQYENGIKDVETAQKLAKALNLAFHLVTNKSELAKVFGKKSLGKGFTVGAAQGPSDPREMTRSRISGEVVAKTIGVLKPYQNKRNPDETVTPLGSLFAGLHEIGHGVEGRFLPGTPEGAPTSRKMTYRRPVDGKPIAVGNVYRGTFRDILASMMDFAVTGKDGRKGYTQQDAQDIIDEIIRFQRTGALTMPDGTSEKVRPSYDEMGAAITRQQAAGRNDLAQMNELALIDFEENYLQTPHEMSADPVAAYFFDPKMTKQQMPKTAKLLREVLNGGDVFTLYSMPLAALLAAIMANMLVAEGEEEEKQGALTLGQGALSA